MRYRARLAKLKAKLFPPAPAPFVLSILGLNDPDDAPPFGTITTTYDPVTHAPTTVEWWSTDE